MVNLKVTERELAPASVAPALLLAEEHVFVLPVRHRRVDVGTPEYVGAGDKASESDEGFLRGADAQVIASLNAAGC